MCQLAVSLSQADSLLREIPFDADDNVLLEEPPMDPDVPEAQELPETHFWDSSLEAETFGLILPEDVHLRILTEQWSEALAAGCKWVETQRYRRNNMNMLKFVKDGCWLVFGSKERLHGIAVLDAPVHRACADIGTSGVLDSVAPQFHEPLLKP